MQQIFRWPYHRDTTHDVGVLFPWQMSANLGVRGPCLGVDWGSDAPWCYDAFELYTRGVLTNANMVVSTFALSRSPTFKLSTTGPRPFFLLHRTSLCPLTPSDELCDLTGQMVG
jgi:hypothetical protein